MVVYTEQGPIPAEHLEPGDRLLARRHGGPVIVRDLRIELTSEALVRVAPDALGRARPDGFTLLPPDQRLRLRSAAGAPADGVFAARDLVDGDTIRWHEPDSPERLVHLVLDSLTFVHAGGMELEIGS